ncbi:hypothetical protein N9948_01320 [bacterium]|nr:hypothetical protein [bacterium]
MEKCDVCSADTETSELTTVTPSKYLGASYPNTTAFCPLCFIKFLRKARKILEDQNAGKLDNLKKFTE